LNVLAILIAGEAETIAAVSGFQRRKNGSDTRCCIGWDWPQWIR